ncbi:MAG: class I SAM-dependent methyltransferase [Chloroflexota bacterium]
MRRLVRFPVIVVAVVGAVAAIAARPAIERVVRSFRTSSSPGAGFYDAAASLFLGGYYDDIAADCAATLAGTGSPAVLEIGPGPGHLAERLLALVPDLRWTGLDIDPAMLAAARQRLTGSGLDDRASLIEGDVAALPFADAAFDLVVSSFSAHHWPDAEAGFGEIRRVLRPGATALVFDLPPGWGHLETGSSGIRGASAAFAETRASRMRGLGPFTIVTRVELRRPA